MKSVLQKCTGFDWDDGNADKNWILHQVTRSESEQVFFNEPIVVADDLKHSTHEKRWYLLGQTDAGRLLFIMSTKKKIPVFKNEKEERAFWAKENAAEYVDWSKAEKIRFSNLKPSTKTISLRLPEFILDELKVLAHKRDIPYQSLIKMFLKDRIDEELGQTQ